MSEHQPTAVVLTALPVEYGAVRAHLVEAVELVHEDGTRAEHGRLPGTPWHVAIAEVGEGAVNAAALTMQIISWLRPEALLFVGVAGSLKHDIGIGDVVIATKVYSIHGGRQTPEGFHARPEVWHGSHRLVQAARSALRGMLGVHYKPVAVSDVVLADDRSVLAEHIRRHYNDACAIEMEGSGAAHAAYLSGQLDTLIVRGISDLANAEKHKADASGSQSQAAERAALAAVTVLRKQQPASSSAVSLQPSRHDPEPVDVGVGERYLGTVLKTVTFGAFVSVLPGKDGLLHISQIRKLAGGKRVDEVADVLGVGARVWVEVAEIDKNGKISLKPVIENGSPTPPQSQLLATDRASNTDGPSPSDASRHDPEPVDVGVGERYLGTVLKTVTFGAFVSVLPGKDGLLHISQIRKLAGGKRVDEVADVLGVGARVWVEVAEIDKNGKISLKPVIENGNASTSRKTS